MKHKVYQNGYSLVEVLIIITLFLILSGLATINLLSGQNKATVQNSLQPLIADIKDQQMKAMQGDTEGRTAPDYYGIHFATTSYTLFHGTSFSSTDPANLTIPLAQGLQFSQINLTNNNVIFIPLNGEFYGYSSIANSVILKDMSSQQTKTLQFNYLGVLARTN